MISDILAGYDNPKNNCVYLYYGIKETKTNKRLKEGSPIRERKADKKDQ